MKVIDFVASQPAEDSAKEKLKHTLEVFRSVADKVKTVGASVFITRETQDRLADEVGADRFMVEDVVSTLIQQTPPIFTEFIGGGFWTLGRHAPRWGTPWGGLIFYDARKSVELLVRYGGSFIDEDDPPQWINCPLMSPECAPYRDLAAWSVNCRALDIWWNLSPNAVAGKLVFR